LRSTSGFAPVQLSFDHLAVDVAIDSAWAVGDGEPGGDGGPVFADSFAETAQLADRIGPSLAGAGFEVIAAAAEPVREVADRGTGRLKLLSAGRDLLERGTIVFPRGGRAV
jgi:hypothetical protein